MSTNPLTNTLMYDSPYEGMTDEEIYEAISSGDINFRAEGTENVRELLGQETYAPRPADYTREDYDIALAEWYQNTPVEALEREHDRMMWATQAYNAGDMDASEAQEMWDEAYYAGLGPKRDSLTGRTEAVKDEDGNVVLNYYTEDGFLRGTSTQPRVVFGETDTSTYDSYLDTHFQQNESFNRGFSGGFQHMFQSFASNPAGMVILGVATAGAASALAPALQASLGMGAAAAKATAAAIVNAGVQAAGTGEVDLKQALISAGTSYVANADWESIVADTGLEGAITSAGDTFDKFQEAISTGNSIADAAIQAGGVDMLTQFVASGEIDLGQAATAAVIAGGTTAFNEFEQSALDSGMSEQDFESWLAEDDAFLDAAIDADLKDPFLNPNYTTIGDGLMANANGQVYNYDGDSIGNMSDLDLDGDGVLNANDLEYVESTGEYKPLDLPKPPTTVEEGKRYYLDEQGNVYDAADYDYVDGGTYKHKKTGDLIYGAEVVTPINGQLMADVDGDRVFDEVWDNKGNRLASYDPETKEWLDAEGNVSTSVGNYMNEINGVGSGNLIDDPFGMTKEQWDNLSGPAALDDYFYNRGQNGMVAMSKQELSSLMNRFDSVEDFEAYMASKGDPNGVRYGVNVYGDQVVIQAGATTDDGIWNITDGSSVDDFLGGPTDTSGTNTIDVGPNKPTTENPFETVEETDGAMPDNVTPNKGGGGNTADAGGSEGGGKAGDNDATSGGTQTPTSGTNSTGGATSTVVDQLVSDYNTAMAMGNSVLASQIAAQLAGMGVSVQSPNTPSTPSDDGMLSGGNTATDGSDASDGSTADSGGTDGSTTTDGSTSNPTDNTTDGGVSNGSNDQGELSFGPGGAVDSGTSSGNGFTDGNASNGTDGSSGNSPTAGGGGAGGGDATGGGGTGGTAGSNDGTGGGGSGTGVDAGSGADGGVDGGTGGGEGEGDGGGVGDGSGGEGGSGGSGGGDGMLSGAGQANYTPEWSELFPYTKVTGYQKKALAPYKDYIQKAKGMLS